MQTLISIIGALALAATACAVDDAHNDELTDLLEEEAAVDGKADGMRPDVVLRLGARDQVRLFNEPAETVFDVLRASGDVVQDGDKTIVSTANLRCGRNPLRTVCVADVADSGRLENGAYFFYDFGLDGAPRAIGAAMIAAGAQLPDRHDIGQIGRVRCTQFAEEVMFAAPDNCFILPEAP